MVFFIFQRPIRYKSKIQAKNPTDAASVETKFGPEYEERNRYVFSYYGRVLCLRSQKEDSDMAPNARDGHKSWGVGVGHQGEINI